MSFSKIVCPTDFSPGAAQAVGVAIELARTHDAELVLVHSWSLPALAFPIEAVVSQGYIHEIFVDARRQLNDAVNTAIAAGVRVRGALFGGVPWMQIVEDLASEHADLCVIGTHGRTGIPRVLLGSVAEKVIRHAPCPVLVVRPGSDVSTYRHVLVPTDFSASAVRAADLAASFVAPTGKLTLLHVLELPIAYSGEIKVEGFARDLDKRTSILLDAEVVRLRRATPATVDAVSRIGYPGGQTLHAVDADPTIDLVVMGSHGRSGIKRALLGSVAEKVVRHARCAVLVERHADTSTTTE